MSLKLLLRKIATSISTVRTDVVLGKTERRRPWRPEFERVRERRAAGPTVVEAGSPLIRRPTRQRGRRAGKRNRLRRMRRELAAREIAAAEERARSEARRVSARNVQPRQNPAPRGGNGRTPVVEKPSMPVGCVCAYDTSSGSLFDTAIHVCERCPPRQVRGRHGFIMLNAVYRNFCPVCAPYQPPMREAPKSRGGRGKKKNKV
jgi:hypothetical protein